MTKRVALVGALFGLAVGAASAAGPADSEVLVKGFARYQAGRVEELILDQLLVKLSEGRYFRQFFPETSKAVIGYDGVSGKRLIPLMRHYFSIDLANLRAFVRCYKDVGKKLGGSAEDIQDALTRIDTLLTLRDAPRKPLTSLDATQCNAAQPTHASFIKLASDVREAMLKSNVIAAGASHSDVTVVTQTIDLDEMFRDNDSYLATLARIESEGSKWWKAKAPFKSTYLAISGESRELLGESDLRRLADAFSALDSMDVCPANSTGEKCEASAAVLVHHLFAILDALDFGAEDHAAFRSFRSAGIFLAKLDSIADASNPDAVSDAIQEYVDDEQTHRDKRAETGIYVWRKGKQSNYWCRTVICPKTLFLSSYFGASATSWDEDGDGESDWRLRAYGPVGLELKLFSWRGRPIAINAAPFDVGAYITNELNGDNYTAKLDDIKAPSYFISVGLRHRPISFIVGYQEGARLADGSKDHFTFGAVTFDLPLMTVY